MFDEEFDEYNDMYAKIELTNNPKYWGETNIPIDELIEKQKKELAKLLKEEGIEFKVTIVRYDRPNVHMANVGDDYDEASSVEFVAESAVDKAKRIVLGLPEPTFEPGPFYDVAAVAALLKDSKKKEMDSADLWDIIDKCEVKKG